MHDSVAESQIDTLSPRDFPLTQSQSGPLTWPMGFTNSGAGLLLRMFRDPRVLEPVERRVLIDRLREAVELQPHVAEVRVLLGMALCVDLQAQEALEQLRKATQLAPDCFIARLKFGELLMRLRICTQAAEETQMAARLATTATQSDLARRQAAQIRTMLREGIERGGYGGFLSRLLPFPRKARSAESAALAAESR